MVLGNIKKDRLIDTTFRVEVTVTATNAPNSLIRAKTKMSPAWVRLSVEGILPMYPVIPNNRSQAEARNEL
jgi:hypothetical protein